MSIHADGAKSEVSAITEFADSLDIILTTHDLGLIERASFSAKRGRNLSCTFETTKHNALFAKNAMDDIRFKASVLAAQTLPRIVGDTDHVLFQLPRLMAANGTDKILIFEDVLNSDSLATVLQGGAVEDNQVRRLMNNIGAGLREVHDQEVSKSNLNSAPSPLPLLSHFSQLPWSSFETLSAESLHTWGTLQQDKELYRAIVSLREMESAGAQVPIHGDLRFDQFLLDTDEGLWLVDWEEYRFGHRGRDLGTLIGEWLYLAFITLSDKEVPNGAVEPTPQPAFDEELTHFEIVARGQEALERVLPFISTIWSSYLGKATPVHDLQDLAAVSAAFAGWHLYDRLLAISELVPRVSALSWAAAGIGRNVLLDPIGAANALGLTARFAPTIHRECDIETDTEGS
ncbi:phosphotransferase [Corynebacterium timonense]|uniref:Phosphotransferase enzyme family protein n=1 Tax=Corynebacterium timonense TaxID=441500 RepID=A0A1H1S384_9CORY|nr:phosphotransferase [Corynebacterium timonense]SDS42421.1 Phosphotransferase enzyme family protein [Corynebacterium timonense]